MSERAAIEREYDEAQRELSAACLAVREANDALQIAEERYEAASEREDRATEALHALPYLPLATGNRQDG